MAEKEKIDLGEIISESLKKKKKKINLDEIVSKAMDKEEPQYITKKKTEFIKKKSPEDIRDREKVKMAKGGRAMYGSGARVCKLAKRGKGKAYGKNS